MPPRPLDASDVLHERPDQQAKDGILSRIATDSWDWLKNNVVNPAYNSGVVQPVGALRSIVNPAAKYVTGSDLPKLSMQSVKTADSIGVSWFCQNVSGGLAGMVPYVLAGKAAGSTMRAGGRYLQLEGGLAKAVASEHVAMMSGAAAYDFARDPLKGETRIGNAAGGLAMFGVIGKGNHMAMSTENMVKRTLFKVTAGGVGADVQAVVSEGISQHRLPTLRKLADHFVTGGAMNIALPYVQAKLNRSTDGMNHALGRGIPIDRFIAQEGIAGKSSSLEFLAAENPLARVQYSHDNSPKFRKNIAHIDERIVDQTTKIAAEREAANAVTGEHVKSAAEIRKEALARELAAELGDIEAGKAGKAGSVLSNRDIAKALKDGRLEVSLPTENKGEFKPVELEHLLPQVGTNSLDLTLGDRFVFLPKGKVVDLGQTNPKDFLRGLKPEVRPEGVLLQPGEFVLAFTKEKITLPSEPKQGWNGEPPLVGEINVQSSLARLGISENITASTLNNGTNNPITHEIKNNGSTAVWLRPGMRFGSVVFHRMSGPPGLGFQQSRMHGQVEPNGGNGNAAELRSIIISPHLPSPETLPAYRPVDLPAAPKPSAAEHNGKAETNGKALEAAAPRLEPKTTVASSTEFGQHMESLRAKYAEHKPHTNQAQEIYRQMAQAEGRFAEQALKNAPQEWDSYLNALKSDPARKSEYLRAVHTERSTLCQMEIPDLLKIADSSRVHDALKLLNDRAKYSEYMRALSSRKLDPETLSRIHDLGPESFGAPQQTRPAAEKAQLAPSSKPSEVATKVEPAAGQPGKQSAQIEELRMQRDIAREKGEDLSQHYVGLQAAERQFAAQVLKTNPQEWYTYMERLRTTPGRQQDYATANQTERFVLQTMEPIDLLKVESSRVVSALSALGDKTKLSTYMKMSTDTRYTLSPEALSRIHDMPPPAGPPSTGSGTKATESSKPPSYFGSKRGAKSNDWIRDVLNQRRQGDLNFGDGPFGDNRFSDN
jgi:deoxycytidine triphosphate deaminase